MGDNRYLDRFEEIKKEISKSKHLRQMHYHAKRGREHYRKKDAEEYMERIPTGNSRGKNPTYNYAQFGYAHAEMKEAKEKGDIQLALSAFKRYENLGKADAHYVLNGLLKTLEKAKERKKSISGIDKIEDILRTYGDVEMKNYGPELLIVASLAGILGGIFFLSFNITGNAIANLSIKTTSWIGAGLLIVGLIAGFFWFKGRRR